MTTRSGAQWLAQFPKLYRLRRWLDDYVALFRSMDRFQESFGSGYDSRSAVEPEVPREAVSRRRR